MELAKRFRLWEEGHFTQLLNRAEEQCRVRASLRNRKKRMPIHGIRARRARQLVSEGAYSKAVTSLTSDPAELTEVDQERWAHNLLPRSSYPDAAISSSPNNGADDSET